MDLKNKVVLLTGASTGIGKGIANAFLERKAKVIVFGQHKPEFCSLFYAKMILLMERQSLLTADKTLVMDN